MYKQQLQCSYSHTELFAYKLATTGAVTKSRRAPCASLYSELNSQIYVLVYRGVTKIFLVYMNYPRKTNNLWIKKSSWTLSLTTKQTSLLISAFWQTLRLRSDYILPGASHTLNLISVGPNTGFHDGFNTMSMAGSIKWTVILRSHTNVHRKEIFHRITNKPTRNTLEVMITHIKKGKKSSK